eukprot:697308-Prorocentrum_minimum.AAC.2
MSRYVEQHAARGIPLSLSFLETSSSSKHLRGDVPTPAEEVLSRCSYLTPGPKYDPRSEILAISIRTVHTDVSHSRLLRIQPGYQTPSRPPLHPLYTPSTPPLHPSTPLYTSSTPPLHPSTPPLPAEDTSWVPD